MGKSEANRAGAKISQVLRVVLVSACIVGGCALLFSIVPQLMLNTLFSKIPSSATNPPIYPGAQNVDIQNYRNGSQTIVFETPDKLADVLAFYTSVLHKDGWGNPLVGATYPSATYYDKIFEWDQDGPNGPTDTAFRLTVTNTPMGSDRILVKVDVQKFDPRMERP